jgi:hypothetical protein
MAGAQGMAEEERLRPSLGQLIASGGSPTAAMAVGSPTPAVAAPAPQAGVPQTQQPSRFARILHAIGLTRGPAATPPVPGTAATPMPNTPSLHPTRDRIMRTIGKAMQGYGQGYGRAIQQRPQRQGPWTFGR